MTEDGWRPIVGTGREPPAFHGKNANLQSKKYFPGNNLNIEIAKSTSINLPSTFPTQKPQKFNVIKNEPIQNQNNGRYNNNKNSIYCPSFPIYRVIKYF